MNLCGEEERPGSLSAHTESGEGRTRIGTGPCPSLLPFEYGSYDRQKRENLDTAEEHVYGVHQLGSRGLCAEIAHDTKVTKSRSHVAERGESSGYSVGIGRIDREIYRQGNYNQHHVQRYVQDVGSDVLLPDHTVVDPDLIY